MVGLGTIARTHLEVLRTRADVTVVAGVDPAARAETFPTYSSVAAALSAGHRPGLSVVATPTVTHVDVARELLDTTDGLVLSEKPLASRASELDTLAAAYPADVLGRRLKVGHHFAFSPEVEHARRVVAQNPGWGAPTRVVCVSNDAYGGLPPERKDVYVSSWVDSGPNQLSVLAGFEPRWQVRSHHDQRERSVTRLDLPGGTAHLVSNWGAADSSKQTHVEFQGGRVEVRVEHTSMTFLVRDGDDLVEHAAYVGTVGRKHAHYRGLYDALLTHPDDERLGLGLARQITRTLEEAAAAPAEPRVRLSEISGRAPTGQPPGSTRP